MLPHLQSQNTGEVSFKIFPGCLTGMDVILPLSITNKLEGGMTTFKGYSLKNWQESAGKGENYTYTGSQENEQEKEN